MILFSPNRRRESLARALPKRTLALGLGVLFTFAALAGAQTWAPLTHQPTFRASTALLLTDGTVMVQAYESSEWWRLTPDSTGSYINGTWTQLASMPSGYTPIYYASAVLSDGRVVVEGGEYNGGNTRVMTNLGAIYNPVTNTWTSISPPVGWNNIGDAQSVVLADGTFMLAFPLTTEAALLNSSTLTWTPTGTGKTGSNVEEGWTLLSNGKVLTIDANNLSNLTNSELYDPATGAWSSAGSTIVKLPDTNADGSGTREIGPAVLRPNGTVFATGGTSNTAVYNTATGTWSVGPTFPNGLDIADGPSALLPNGNVLVDASPGIFNRGAEFFEFDGASLIPVPGPSRASSQSSYEGRMVVLPTGQILFTDGSSDVEIYTAGGTYQSAWRPTISSFPSSVTPGIAGYSLSGTQLNGLSQGAMYGDDAQSATNYPLVRITNNATGHVFYAKTHNHSTMGVATGSAIVSTQFDVPAGIETGSSQLTVVANGIPSASVAIQVAAAVNYVGTLEHAGCDTLSGWAADRNRLNTSITVSIYDNGALLTTFLANNSRPDVGASLGDNGLHGFSIPTPLSLRDGNAHQVSVRFESSSTNLASSPTSLTCAPNYVGNLEHAGCDTLSGWAADRNRLNTSINVSIYNNGALLTTVLANASRPDVGAFLGDNGLHGFSIPTPLSLRDGNTHTVNVRFESSGTDFASSPVSLTCTPALPAARLTCGIEARPAATLLLPYFEVDLANPNGVTTLFSINNASSLAVLAHVVVWSDLSVPVLDFNVYLTGYDVQSINLADILVRGVLPRTASAGQDPSDTISPHGGFSQDINFASCTGQLPISTLPAIFITHLQTSLTGQFSSLIGGCAGFAYGDNLARGYVTVDTVNNCTLRFPGDSGYFLPGGTGDATDQNVLLGDYFYINSSTNLADGYTMVHIEADPQSPETSIPGQYTFYGRYVGWSAADNREPLSTNFFTRYQNGGPFSGGTTVRTWRDSKVKQGAFKCGTPPAWYPLGQEQIVIFDEQEHPQVPTSSPVSPTPPQSGIIPFPAAAQSTAVGGASFQVPYSFGWIFINMNTTVPAGGNVPPEDPAAAQAWMTTTMGSLGRYSVGYDAFQMDSACSASHHPLP